MKFFVPGAKSETTANEVYDAIRKFATDTLGWQTTERRIQSITFRDKGKSVLACVGQPDPVTGEMVIAILESATFLICTMNRGVKRGQPVMVGKQELEAVTDFDP